MHTPHDWPVDHKFQYYGLLYLPDKYYPAIKWYVYYCACHYALNRHGVLWTLTFTGKLLNASKPKLISKVVSYWSNQLKLVMWKGRRLVIWKSLKTNCEIVPGKNQWWLQVIRKSKIKSSEAVQESPKLLGGLAYERARNRPVTPPIFLHFICLYP